MYLVKAMKHARKMITEDRIAITDEIEVSSDYRQSQNVPNHWWIDGPNVSLWWAMMDNCWLIQRWVRKIINILRITAHQTSHGITLGNGILEELASLWELWRNLFFWHFFLIAFPRTDFSKFPNNMNWVSWTSASTNSECDWWTRVGPKEWAPGGFGKCLTIKKHHVCISLFEALYVLCTIVLPSSGEPRFRHVAPSRK